MLLLSCQEEIKSEKFNIVCFSTELEDNCVQTIGSVERTDKYFIIDISQNGIELKKEYLIISEENNIFEVKEDFPNSNAIIKISQKSGVINFIYHNSTEQPFAMYNGYIELNTEDLSNLYFFYQ
tara:strand:+ start:773 stop:1144 length:372 start_codon:yes stop_codon:yes gene_type:complete